MLTTKGRIKILSDIIPTGDVKTDKNLLPALIKATMKQHEINVGDMKQLKNYFYNETPILAKVKIAQPDINNKIGIPYANLAVTTINGYCFSKPFTYSTRNSKASVVKMIKQFNDALDDDNYNRKLLETTLNSGTTGLGYRYIIPADESEVKKGIYFKSVSNSDPEFTYCVYSNDLKQEKVCAINYYGRKVYDNEMKVVGTETVYNVWTKWHQWEFIKKGSVWTNSTFEYINEYGDIEQYEAYPLPYNRIPIIEYPRKQDRTSDFEIAIPLIDGLNELVSSRVDDVQQKVDYILVLRDIDTSEGAIENIKKNIKNGILSFSSVPNATVQPDVKTLQIGLNQSEVQSLQDELCQKIEEVLNIPNRETHSSGDNGVAVEARNGTRSLENIAGLITASTLASENEALDVILAICSNYADCPFKKLSVDDIEIKENRNKIANLVNSANAYGVLKSNGMNDQKAIEICELDPDAITTAELNEQYADRQQEKEIEYQKRLKEVNQASDGISNE